MKLEFSRQIFQKASNIKFHENPSSGSQVVPREQMDGRTNGETDGRTDGWADGRTDGGTDGRTDGQT
jgi:hypothetical protein